MQVRTNRRDYCIFFMSLLPKSSKDFIVIIEKTKIPWNILYNKAKSGKQAGEAMFTQVNCVLCYILALNNICLFSKQSYFASFYV